MNWRSRLATIRKVGLGQVLLARTWIAMSGDERARKGLRLPPNPLVFDVGAYEGEFTQHMRRDWNARVIAIEPIPEFASALSLRFEQDDSVTILPAALGSSSGRISIALADNGSSAWIDAAESVTVPLVDVSDIVAGQVVSLMKLNAEGAEFDVLERLIATGQSQQIEIIQVQFHKFVPRAVTRRRAIRSQLKATHRCAWSVPWVWEQWVRRDGPS